jgi:protein phosphatase
VYFLDDSLIIGHVGDSRCYRARGTEMTQLTEDHSLINDYPDEAGDAPRRPRTGRTKTSSSARSA